MDEVKFADMFAQTLVYGLLTSRISSPDQFEAAEGRALLDFEKNLIQAIEKLPLPKPMKERLAIQGYSQEFEKS